MTATGEERLRANERLIAALTELDVFSRIDEDGRVLASDGAREYEVTVDLARLLTKRIDGHLSRRIAVGKSSLARLEAGDVTALFPNGSSRSVDEATGKSEAATPVSPHYRPLEWGYDADDVDDEDAIAAQGEDWTYRVRPVRGADDEIIGYRISGGDIESGDHDFGSALIGGEIGELTLSGARGAAQADYAARYLEAEAFLGGLLLDWEDDDGPRTRVDEHGRFLCRVDESAVGEVEVVATLRDFGDRYDARDRRVTLCLRTILSYTGGYGDMLEDVGNLIRRSN